MGRQNIQPILETLPDMRQKLARHYGVHPYFTRRSANVVQAYVRRFTEPGDVVLDPFGGSGVTGIEAFLMGRVGVHNDINPFANFLAQTIADTTLTSIHALKRAFEDMESAVGPDLLSLQKAPDDRLAGILSSLPLPNNIPLPRTSDAQCFHDLFTPRQLAGLTILKSAIERAPDPAVRAHLLLAWSAAAAKLNRTFISTKGRAESRGGSSIFSIYRYKLAKQVVELPLWDTFRQRFLNVVAAKDEVLAMRDMPDQGYLATVGGLDSRRNLRILCRDATQLPRVMGEESVDYIFTDPPYGAHIAYLDLSTLWNHWLGFTVGDEDREAEIIVGGERRHSEQHYKDGLAASLRACMQLLKPDRWLSVVFQHWDLTYFETILSTVTAEDGVLKSAITQERDVVWSMHKKKHAESVLSGEMILTFYKPQPSRKSNWTAHETHSASLGEMIDGILQAEGALLTEITSQYLFNKLILLAWEHRSLSEITIPREAFAEELRRRGWTYNSARHVWTLPGARAAELFNTSP